ncbi:MAG: serine/threonine protein kinase [Muribaculaceae bacterium]|nr:serine/threonine protein kinase [Muribaculaceae bacterium]
MATFLTDYTLLDEIGRGAFASVYKVRHNQLGYVRAVRVLNQTIATGENDVTYQKFLNECKILLRLGNGNNPHIVHIYQPLLRDSKALVEMDYIDGMDLHHYLDENNRFVDSREAVHLAREIGKALAYCHHDIYKACMDREIDDLQDDPDDGSKVLIDDRKKAELVKKYQVIHNDLHSGNIMRRTDGMYVLLDFGLSIQDGNVQRSSVRHGGAPEYKAPEKWDNDALITCQSDIFSFGIILYEMLTGHVPFMFDTKKSNQAEAEYNLMKAIKNVPTPPIQDARRSTFEATHPGQTYKKDYPDWLETLIMRCLEKNIEDRFASGRELYDFILEQEEDSNVTINRDNKQSSAQTAMLLAQLKKEKLLNTSLKAEKQSLQDRIEIMEGQMGLLKEQIEELTDELAYFKGNNR